MHNAGGESYDNSNNQLDDILQFNPETGEWMQIGALKNKRSYHAVSVVNFNSINDFCF